MIQNPNVYVRNFSELPLTSKLGKIKTGLITSDTINYTGVKQSYMIIRAEVKTGGDAFLETYLTLRTDRVPVLKDFATKQDIDRVVLAAPGTYLLYAELFSVDAFKLEIGAGDGTTVADIYVTFADTLPELSFDNHGMRATFANGKFVDNTFAGFVFDRSKRWLVLDVLGKNGNNTAKSVFLYVNNSAGERRYPMAYSGNLTPALIVGGTNPSRPVPNNGATRLIYDLSTITLSGNIYQSEQIQDGIFFLGNGNLNNDTGYTMSISFVAQTNDITQYVVNKEVAANNGKYKFIGYRRGVAYWGDYYVEHTGGSGILNVGKGTDSFVQININHIIDGFGDLDNPNSHTHLIPFDSDYRNNTNQSVGLIVYSKGLKKYYFCNLTTENGIEAIRTASNWKVVKFWEKIGTSRKIPTKTPNQGASYRYDTTLPEALYEKTETSGSLIQYQGTPLLTSLGPFAYGKKVVACAMYDTTGERPVLWATSDGGQNWVGVYDFATQYTNIPTANRDDRAPRINTAAFAAYTSGGTLYKITPIYPSDNDKEPAHILSLTEILFTNISSANGCVVTAQGHGLASGDLVAFTGALTGDWAQLANSGISEDSLGDNIYFVDRIDANSFYLRYYNGSYDTILPCRHIHSANVVGDGILFATGEYYPAGWIMLYQINRIDLTTPVNIMSVSFDTYRLNSSALGVQRACGVLLTAGVQPDLIFCSDDMHILDGQHGPSAEYLSIDGRTPGGVSGTPPIMSNGIWRGKLSKIDDLMEYERLLDIPEPMIWLYRQGNTIIGRGMLDGIVVSYDGGDTWDYIPRPDGVTPEGTNVIPFNGVKDGEICFGNGWTLRKN